MADRPFQNPILAKIGDTDHYVVRSAWECDMYFYVATLFFVPVILLVTAALATRFRISDMRPAIAATHAAIIIGIRIGRERFQRRHDFP